MQARGGRWDPSRRPPRLDCLSQANCKRGLFSGSHSRNWRPRWRSTWITCSSWRTTTRSSHSSERPERPRKRPGEGWRLVTNHQRQSPTSFPGSLISGDGRWKSLGTRLRKTQETQRAVKSQHWRTSVTGHVFRSIEIVPRPNKWKPWPKTASRSSNLWSRSENLVAGSFCNDGARTGGRNKCWWSFSPFVFS